MSSINVTDRHALHPIAHPRPVWLLLAVCCWLSAASGQPFPSHLLDTAYVIGPDQRGASRTASAFKDTTGIVVWNSDGHVKGCLTTNGRVSTTAACIDISGPNETFSATPLDVAKSPEGYLVVWCGDQGYALRGAIVSPGGAVVMRETVALCTMGWPIANPAVAFDGANYLVAWDETSAPLDHKWVLCARVSSAGEVLDSPHKVCPAGGAQRCVSLSFGDSCFLAAYWYWEPGQADSGIWCSRILPSGVVLDSAGIPVRHWQGPGADNTQASTTIGFDGSNFVVGWTEYLLPPSEVRAARVTTSGMVLDPEGLTVGTVQYWTQNVSAASVRDTTLLVWTRTWNDTVTIAGRRLSGAGELLDTIDIFITPPVCANHSNRHPECASVSRSGDDFLISYRDYASHAGALYDCFDVLCRRVSAAGLVLDTAGTLLSYAANYQTEADAASDGQAYLAVWTELRSGATARDCAVYGVRFSNEDGALDPSVRISPWSSHTPSVAYGADCYLVSWLTDFGEDSAQVWAARVGRDGVPLDSNPIRLPGTVFDFEAGVPDVAFGDSLFLVVWYYGGTGCAEGARVRADGQLLDSVPILLRTPSRSVHNTPRIAGDGHNFLVVWEGGAISHVYGMRLGSTGQVLDSTAIDFGRAGSADDPPYVAYGAGVYLVAESWAVDWAWRVTPGGVVLDTIHFAPHLIYPEVAYDGTNFILVEGVGNGFRAVRVSPQGEIMDSLAFTIIDLRSENTYLTEHAFGLTADLQGHVGMAFPTYESNPYVSARVRASAFPAVVGAVDEQGVVLPNEARRARIISSATPLAVSLRTILLDISGRKVLDLRPGANDVRALAPGVYFVREASRVAREASRVTKVVVTR